LSSPPRINKLKKVAKKTSLLQTTHTSEKNVISNSRQKKSLKRRASCFFFEVKFKTESCWPIVQKGWIIRRGVSFWPGASGDPQFKTLELFNPTNQVSLTKKPKRPSCRFVSFRFLFLLPVCFQLTRFCTRVRCEKAFFRLSVCLSFFLFLCVRHHHPTQLKICFTFMNQSVSYLEYLSVCVRER